MFFRHSAQRLLIRHSVVFCKVTSTTVCSQVNTVLAEELKTVHALAIKKCLTPEQQAALQPQK